MKWFSEELFYCPCGFTAEYEVSDTEALAICPDCGTNSLFYNFDVAA